MPRGFVSNVPQSTRDKMKKNVKSTRKAPSGPRATPQGRNKTNARPKVGRKPASKPRALKSAPTRKQVTRNKRANQFAAKKRTAPKKTTGRTRSVR